MSMTVGEARGICEKSPCTIQCPLRDLCKLTADIGPNLSTWYSFKFPDDKPVSEVVAECISEHEYYLEGLRQLKF